MTNFCVKDLTCEYRIEALGLGVERPRFSWRMESSRRATLQEAYRLFVSGPERNFEQPLWDSGRVISEQSIHVPYDGPDLKSRTRYYYQVKVWDQAGEESDWSEVSWFETGLLKHTEWLADWITPDTKGIDSHSEPSFLLRKAFELQKEIASARIYATAAGIYELYINGYRISEDLFTPGWTSYRKRIQYQTYDVAGFLAQGENAIGVQIGDGWYKGRLGFENANYLYGEHRAVLLQMHVTYTDGTESVITSDKSWKSEIGPILYSNIYHGETYDARREIKGWSCSGFDDADWKSTETLDLPMNVLVAQENWPTRVTETIRPIAGIVTPSGDHVLDMGQNMVGRIRFTVSAPAGTQITLRHAEVLDKDGNIYFGNLRFAKQTVVYTTKGEETESYEPHFSFMGFRYVKVEGFPCGENGLPLDAFVGEVIHSDMASTGEFECSNELVNQLQNNIKWGQRGNFLDLPTDCPQRDERLGWTGDAQVFISTALFNYQGGPFFTKWLHDLKAEQHPNGGVPFVIPDIVGDANSAAWGDAAVICPWAVYQYYGDRRLLAEQYDSMKAWVEYIRSQGDNKYLWNTGFHFGDWLALDAKENSYFGATPDDLVATAYYAYSTRIVRDAAHSLGRAEEARQYDELYSRIIEEFRNEFVTANGRMAAPTQTAHVLALTFELVDENMRARVAKDLNKLIVDNGYHLTTGFVGTPYLCFALSGNGYHDTAVKLLMQESYPGWLYSVSKGATTIWEHWDSIKPDGSFWKDDMNSFNHYSYGAIGDWMYRKVAGLDMDLTVPAFKRIRIEPMFGRNKLTYARSAHQSMYGRIESDWRIEDRKRVGVKVRIPANCTAEVVLRSATAEGLTESGQAVERVNGILSVTVTDAGVRLEVGSGMYHFAYETEAIFRTQYNADTIIEELLSDEAAREVLNKHIPDAIEGTSVHLIRDQSLKQLSENGMVPITSDQLDAIEADLAAVG